MELAPDPRASPPRRTLPGGLLPMGRGSGAGSVPEAALPDSYQFHLEYPIEQEATAIIIG